MKRKLLVVVGDNVDFGEGCARVPFIAQVPQSLL